VPDSTGPAARTFPRKRADARRNEQALLDAAAAVFVASGVDAPVRDIAAAASGWARYTATSRPGPTS
jgi:AcrR family transcriptional regulator